jgi:hypothetical protein
MLYDASVFLGIDKQQSTKEILKKGLKEDTMDCFQVFYGN